jgi:hypothetical protein
MSGEKCLSLTGRDWTAIILQPAVRTEVEILEISRLAVGQSQESRFWRWNNVARVIVAKSMETEQFGVSSVVENGHILCGKDLR